MTAKVHQLATLDNNQLNLELKFGTLTRINKQVGPFVSYDDGRFILSCVHITAHDGWLRLEATDSYKLIRAETDIEVSAGTTCDLLLPWPWMQRTMRGIVNRSLPVFVTLTKSTVEVVSGEDKWSTSFHVGTDYPNLDNLITTNYSGIEQAAFDPEKLVQLCSAIHREGTAGVRLVQLDKMKPMIVELYGDRHSWPGVAMLMPVRVP